jgi:hypothetical protein
MADGPACSTYRPPRLALVDDLGKTPTGALGISAQVISGSGAGSVLLGGRRTLAPDAVNDVANWTIDASGTRTLMGGSRLQPLVRGGVDPCRE